MHRSPGIYLTDKLNSRQIGDYVNNHRLKCSPLPPSDVDKIAQHVRDRKKQGRKERKDPILSWLYMGVHFLTLYPISSCTGAHMLSTEKQSNLNR